jgi:transposase
MARAWVTCGVTDLRNGFDRLAGLVQTEVAEFRFSGSFFAFRGGHGDRVKASKTMGRASFKSILARPVYRAPATNVTVHLTAA